MLAVSIFALVVAYLGIVAGDPFVQRYEYALSAAIAVVFVAELAFFVWIVDRPLRFLRGNWLLLVVCLGLVAGLALPDNQNWLAFVRLLRLLAAGLLTLDAAGGLRTLSARSAPGLILAGGGLLVTCGAAFYAIDPRIVSLGDGMWLSFVTATTVGYGDLVPATTLSRLFAVVTVLLGASMMALFTATITARFLGSEEARHRHELHQELQRLHREIAALRAVVQPPPEPEPDERQREVS